MLTSRLRGRCVTRATAVTFAVLAVLAVLAAMAAMAAPPARVPAAPVSCSRGVIPARRGRGHPPVHGPAARNPAR